MRETKRKSVKPKNKKGGGDFIGCKRKQNQTSLTETRTNDGMLIVSTISI